MPQNIVTTTNIHIRARKRTLLAPSFNEQALRDYALVLNCYASTVIERLESIYNDHIKAGKSATINVLDWVNPCAIGIAGDFSLGEFFHCLDESDYHPYVRTLYNFLKGMIIAAAVRFFPGALFLLERLIAQRIVQKQREHIEFTDSKILQRLSSKSIRPDQITPFLREMKKGSDEMSLEEIQSTFAILIVAGNEATATTLLRAFYKLATHEDVQNKLFES